MKERRSSGGAPVPIGGALRETLRAQGLVFLLHENRLREQWARVLGEQAAPLASLESLRDGVLTARVAEAAWRQELHYRLEEIRRQANAVLGGEIVREVRLR